MFTLYTKPRCVQCDATKRFFERNEIQYKTIDVTEDVAGMAYIRDTLGYQQVPVVVAIDGNHWSGFRPDFIRGYS